jgi:hypothetical protein
VIAEGAGARKGLGDDLDPEGAAEYCTDAAVDGSEVLGSGRRSTGCDLAKAEIDVDGTVREEVVARARVVVRDRLDYKAYLVSRFTSLVLVPIGQNKTITFAGAFRMAEQG